MGSSAGRPRPVPTGEPGRRGRRGSPPLQRPGLHPSQRLVRGSTWYHQVSVTELSTESSHTSRRAHPSTTAAKVRGVSTFGASSSSFAIGAASAFPHVFPADGPQRAMVTAVDQEIEDLVCQVQADPLRQQARAESPTCAFPPPGGASPESRDERRGSRTVGRGIQAAARCGSSARWRLRRDPARLGARNPACLVRRR